MSLSFLIRVAALIARGVILLFIGVDARAFEHMRPVHPSELLIGTVPNFGYRVRTARVTAINRFALGRDFASLRGRPMKDFEDWILTYAPYLNEHQLPLIGIRSSEIDLDFDDRIVLHVEPGAGRGTQTEVDGGMLSVKSNGNTSWNRARVELLRRMARRDAAGLREARCLDHHSGLEDYPGAVAEYVRHFEIQQDYDRRAARGAPSAETVEAYFVLDWGFDVIGPRGATRAFAIGRQAHFGRTARHLPFADEVYADAGAYQRTYSGARIDFGGSRTEGEAILSYHEQARRAGPDGVGEFIRREVEHIGSTPAAAPRADVPFTTLLDVLKLNLADLERTPVPEAIGNVDPPAGKIWVVDDPNVAALKFRLLRMTEAERNRVLDELSDAHLGKLYALSQYEFQMPLPWGDAYRMRRGCGTILTSADGATF